MHILQPNHLLAERALLKVFPQTTSIWGEFGRENRFGQLFEKSQGRDGGEGGIGACLLPAQHSRLSGSPDTSEPW